MLVNAAGRVFVGQRIDRAVNSGSGEGDFWQMPQGGSDDGEDVTAAGLRELAEETGIGADKVAINTAAVLRPELISECADRFGVQCIVVAIDAARLTHSTQQWQVLLRSGVEQTHRDAIEWARFAATKGAGEILLTSWDRDGTRSGYELELTSAVAAAVNIPVIASGGAAGPEHFLSALNAGADAVLAASIFHEGEFTVKEVNAL